MVALGGLSESGKSTAGHYLATRHGYARLKIGCPLAAAVAAPHVPGGNSDVPGPLTPRTVPSGADSPIRQRNGQWR